MAFSTWRYIQISVFCAAIGLAFVLEAPNRNDISIDTGLLHFIHLLSCSLWFGVQSWVTFGAALIMFRNLPYHTFGYIQSKLLPVYFGVGSFLCFSAIVSFLVANPFCVWSLTECSEMVALLVSLTTVIVNEIGLHPRASCIMFECQMKEKAQGLGDTPGRVDITKMKDDADYIKLRKSFQRIHGASMILNLSGFLAMTCHVWHLAMELRAV